MDHVIVLLVGLDGFVFLQSGDDRPIRCDAKSTLEEHLAVLGNNTCVSIVEVLGIGHRFPGKRCSLICALTENGRTLFEKRYRSGGARKVQLKVVFLILKYYLGLATCIDSYM